MRLIRKIRSKKDSKVLAMIEKANLFKKYVFLIIGTAIYAAAFIVLLNLTNNSFLKII